MDDKNLNVSFKRGFVYLLAGSMVMAAAGVFIFIFFPAAQKRSSSPPYPPQTAGSPSPATRFPPTSPTVTSSPKTGWEDRLVYDAFDLYFQEPAAWQPDLRSANLDGSGEKIHPFLCDGETALPFGNRARSPNGQLLAFLLPPKELRQNNPDWKQGLREQIFSGKTPDSGGIYLYNLENDSCRSLDKIADNLYAQNLAFSSNGRYLAYVFYGLRVYDLQTNQDYYYTAKEGSAAFPEVILGPLSWNQTSSTVYFPVIGFDPPHSESKYPTKLSRVDISEATDINRLDFPENAADDSVFHSLRGEASAKNETTLTSLPDFHPEQYDSPDNSPPINSIFDQPHLYAVSPDKKSIAFEKDKSLVVRDLNSGGETTLWQRPLHSEEEYGQYYTQRLQKIVWTADDKLVFATSQDAPGSGIGDIWLSDKRQKPQPFVHGFGFSTSPDWEKIAYNFDYFGSYYLPENESYPQDFEPSGHHYEGIAVYDFASAKEIKLSGKNKPTGSLWRWFQ